MLTNKRIEQEVEVFELMQEVQFRARKQGIFLSWVHDSVVCSAKNAAAIDQIFKEVDHDFKRNKALVTRS